MKYEENIRPRNPMYKVVISSWNKQVFKIKRKENSEYITLVFFKCKQKERILASVNLYLYYIETDR